MNGSVWLLMRPYVFVVNNYTIFNKDMKKFQFISRQY